MSVPASEAQWRALAAKAVGGDFERLRTITYDGVTIEPLYPRSRRAADDWRPRQDWAVSQRVDHPDPAAANRLAHLDLEGGADALTLVCAGSPYARGFGVASTHAALDEVLAGVELDLISLRLDAGEESPAAIAALVAIAAERRLTSAGLALDLGFDPIGLAARAGSATDMSAVATVVGLAEDGGMLGRPLMADGRPYHEAGAGEAQELACVLATAVAYLRHLAAAGQPLDAARKKIAVLLATDADVFLGIAKVRALRALWGRVEAASGLDPEPVRLHAETSWRMMTRYDPHANVMRATAAVCAAGLGGADAVTALPMTMALGLPDEAARRLARNIGRVLIDEANLAKVDDPAGGSGALDALTDELCRRAWTLFQRLEGAGGMVAALADGWIQREIAATADKRRHDVATLAHGIVGTSRFPALDAVATSVLAETPHAPATATVAALPSARDAEPFERLRDRAAAQTVAGIRPTVFLAALGPPAEFGARAGFATNLLAAAGIAATAASEVADPDALAPRFAGSGTTVACLCGTDARYREQGEAALAALRRSGATTILLVGSDRDWLGAGVDRLLHAGADAPRLLGDILDALARQRLPSTATLAGQAALD